MGTPVHQFAIIFGSPPVYTKMRYLSSMRMKQRVNSTFFLATNETLIFMLSRASKCQKHQQFHSHLNAILHHVTFTWPLACSSHLTIQQRNLEELGVEITCGLPSIARLQ